MTILDVADHDSLSRLVGKHLATSRWTTVDQSAIDEFGRITHDTHWSHTDPARAVEHGYPGTTVHGYLTLALVSGLFQEAVVIRGAASTVNYGLDRVRFLVPVWAGSRLRLATAIEEVRPTPGWVDVVFDNRMELDGSERPACVARSVLRFISPPS
jgi:acyl dehydratase